MKKRLLGMLGFCMLPLAANATSGSLYVTFNLINMSDVRLYRTVSVTDANISYQFSSPYGLDPNCSTTPVTFPLSDYGITLPIKVPEDIGASVSIPVPDQFVTCLNNNTGSSLSITLNILKVDDKGTQSQSGTSCGPGTLLPSMSNMSSAGIVEQSATFYCVPLMLKK